MLGTVWAQDTGKAKGKSGAGGDMAQHLKDLENQWNTASKNGDGKGVGALLADDWVGIDSDGSMRDKAAAVDRTGKAKMQTSELSDMKVKMHGSNTAVVTGTWRGKGTDADGKAIDETDNWIDTWMKQPNGKWQCIASGGAQVKTTQAAKE